MITTGGCQVRTQKAIHLSPTCFSTGKTKRMPTPVKNGSRFAVDSSYVRRVRAPLQCRGTNGFAATQTVGGEYHRGNTDFEVVGAKWPDQHHRSANRCSYGYCE